MAEKRIKEEREIQKMVLKQKKAQLEQLEELKKQKQEMEAIHEKQMQTIRETKESSEIMEVSNASIVEEKFQFRNLNESSMIVSPDKVEERQQIQILPRDDEFN